MLFKKENYPEKLKYSIIVASCAFIIPSLYALTNAWRRSTAFIPIDYLYIMMSLLLVSYTALRGWLISFYALAVLMIVLGLALLVGYDVHPAKAILGFIWILLALVIVYQRRKSQQP
jgi:hypothetical protein